MATRDNRPIEEAQQRAAMLVDALPWIRQWSGSTIVVKYGGAAMENNELKELVMSDVLLMKLMGVNVVLVHGGGKAISKLMSRLQLPVAFKDGLRVTDEAAMEAVQMVLVGKVNTDLVQSLNRYGNYAVGISGSDGRTLEAEQLDAELGRVGRVTKVNTQLIQEILDDGFIPVVAGVGMGSDGSYNINADLAASQVAAALGADKLFFLTDVDGLYEDFSDKDSLIAQMTLAEAKSLLDAKALSKGMIPKIEGSVEAIEAGVGQVTILNGTFPHSMLIETYTTAGIGTMITRE